ncbi:dienelactone hydrolase family protein [Lutibaculum baratangense]|uniref:Protein-L-isoaspartate O-methyltransferase n=1 Tax=Lutibaculum baratangense AMV1 TaxID=631454 RepID=V4RF51_9HYPH|nr:alpha/beta family hydrolase [Lutibaculum baratangense]ESR23994.1 Protein-L-isoaspartate O-methyltransferase [Lutibaculum baratangense AMV1]
MTVPTSALEGEVAIGEKRLEGMLELPPNPRGLVVFAHGSGSSRFSPRNNLVAGRLRERGSGTLLFDLLTDSEAQDRRNVFDIPLLADRMAEAVEWARRATETRDLPVGLFGASTGAAAALVAAANLPGKVSAVVSRGGRPDRSGDALPRVKVPTLLIVGGADYGVIALNEAAFARLACKKDLRLVQGARHLFEEPGTLEAVVEFAAGWFEEHRAPQGDGQSG